MAGAPSGENSTRFQRRDVVDLDAGDPLSWARDRFYLPRDVIYLNGNSLGALPVSTGRRMEEAVRKEWGESLIRGWTKHNWIHSPNRVGDKIAKLVGAQREEVIVCDSTSVNLFKLISAALRARPGRKTVLSEPGNFPTDLYIIQGLLDLLDSDYRLELRDRCDLVSSINEDTALVLLTHVHYKSAEVFDMAEITAQAHDNGALTLWDLSHSAGAMKVDLNDAGADLAVGCGYKFLNGGPGCPAFLFVSRRLQSELASPLTGWMGHARPFEFSDEYTPSSGISRFLCGTPQVLGLIALEEGVEVVLEAGVSRIEEKARKLCQLLIDLAELECGEYGLQLTGPAPGEPRGSHVSFQHREGFAIMQALIAEGVIGDFRAPDVIRFGLSPLYNSFDDVGRAVSTLRELLVTGAWDRPEYRIRSAVT